MGKTFQIGAGDKVKLYVALLPLGDRTEPTDVTVTASAGFAANDTTITVDVLTGIIPGGTPLEFTDGTDAVTVYLTEDAKVGDTELKIENASAGLTGAVGADYTAKLRLLGGTQLDVSINANRTDVLVFEDPLGYMDGAITSQGWELPWTANLLTTDPAYRRVFYAASQAISGREVWIWQEDPPPAGRTTGDGLKGSAVITGFQKSMPSDGIVTFNCTFMGQGSPTIVKYDDYVAP